MTKRELRRMILPLLVLGICGMFVLLERIGVILKEQPANDFPELIFTDAVTSEPECLIIYDAANEVSTDSYEMMAFVLDEMRILHDDCQPAEFESELLQEYRTVVLAMEDWSLLGEKIFDIAAWVNEGGAMMNTLAPLPNATFRSVAGLLGVMHGGNAYAQIRGITIAPEAMIGATEEATYILSDEPMDISLSVGLKEDAKVYVSSDDKTIPLMWSTQYGEGRFVIVNENLTEKYKRGLLSTAYSLMEDVCIYPVINGSAFYLDDFPAPVPEGDGEFIERDYGIDIDTFYAVVWWPRVLSWYEQYGIKFTGVVIENYNDMVEGEFPRNELADQFESYGNMLLNVGGEIGFHGYNHMPLCIQGIDDDRQFADYKLWPSEAEIMEAMAELLDFCQDLYPKVKFKVYVPPSNIISEAGIVALKKACPDVNVIAGTFLEDAESRVYEQEFMVDQYGIIHTPRVVSGCVFNDYSRLMALSELNFHFVQNHFTHPDDVLDEERGADLGWEKLAENWEGYIDWVYQSAPMIRNMTGSELGQAVVQYCNITMNRTVEEGKITVKIGGFSGSAYFMMRINEGEIADTLNCRVEHVTGDIYLVFASADEIQIKIN